MLAVGLSFKISQIFQVQSKRCPISLGTVNSLPTVLTKCTCLTTFQTQLFERVISKQCCMTISSFEKKIFKSPSVFCCSQSTFRPNLSAQAQKFGIFGKKNSLWVSIVRGCDNQQFWQIISSNIPVWFAVLKVLCLMHLRCSLC